MRLIVPFAFALFNVQWSFYAKNLGGDDGHKLAVMLVCGLFGLALSQLFWERDGQKKFANEFKITIYVSALTAGIYFFMLKTGGILCNGVDLILMLIVASVYSRYNVAIRKLMYDQCDAPVFFLAIYLITSALLFFIIAPNLFKINWRILVLINSIFLLVLLYYFVPNRTTLNYIDVEYKSFHSLAMIASMVTFDFVKNQSWVFFHKYYSSDGDVAEIMLLRQFVGPFALLMSAYKSHYFDGLLRIGQEPSFLQYSARSYCAPTIFIVAMCVAGATDFVSVDRKYEVQIAVAWIFVIISQDIKSYFMRMAAPVGTYFYMSAFLSALPFGLLFLAQEANMVRVNLIYVLSALILSELVGALLLSGGVKK